MDKPYSSKSDIWSLGCVLYEAVCLKPPFRSDSMEGLFRRVMSGVFSPIPKHYSKGLSGLIQQMISIDAKRWPSCEDILQNSFVQEKIDLIDVKHHYESAQDILLQTIWCPKNFQFLQSKLPRSNYEDLDSKYVSSTLLEKNSTIDTIDNNQIKIISDSP